MTVYERIETLRREQKISQGKLEKQLGFSNGSISKWKNSPPTAERLQKIADYFDFFEFFASFSVVQNWIVHDLSSMFCLFLTSHMLYLLRKIQKIMNLADLRDTLSTCFIHDYNHNGIKISHHEIFKIFFEIRVHFLFRKLVKYWIIYKWGKKLRSNENPFI